MSNTSELYDADHNGFVATVIGNKIHVRPQIGDGNIVYTIEDDVVLDVSGSAVGTFDGINFYNRDGKLMAVVRSQE